MRWLILTLLFSPMLALAKVVTLTITPSYTLSPTDAQIICTSIYANLSTSALIKIEHTKGETPYSCTLSDTKLIIQFALK